MIDHGIGSTALFEKLIFTAGIEDDFLGGVVFEFVCVGVDEDHELGSFIGGD